MDKYQNLPKTGLVAALLLMAGCAQQPTVQTGPDAETIGGGLYKIDNSRVEEAYMDPTVDFSKFEDIFINQLDVSNVNIVQPGAMRGRHSKFELTEEDRTLLQNIYLDKMYRYLFDRGGYMEAERPGEGTLIVKVAVVQIAPAAPKDDMRSRGAGRTRIYSENAGSISIKGILKDGGSGKVIAVFSDTRESNTYWGRNDRFNNLNDVKSIFDYWAQLFQYRLEELNGEI